MTTTPVGSLPSSTRDEKLDFWRGLCIVGMVSWHLLSHPSFPRALSFAVIQSFNFVAEGFVLLAGASIGWQFRRRPEEISRPGPHLARAARFLLLHYAIAAALITLICSTTWYEPVRQRPLLEWARDILLLEYQPYLGDVLNVFIFLFALAPVMLFVLLPLNTSAPVPLLLMVTAPPEPSREIPRPVMLPLPLPV